MAFVALLTQEVPVHVDIDCLAAAVACSTSGKHAIGLAIAQVRRHWHRRIRNLRNAVPREQRTVELNRLTLELTLELTPAVALTLEFLPHLEMALHQQLDTMTRNPALEMPLHQQLATTTRNPALAKATPATWMRHPLALTTTDVWGGMHLQTPSFGPRVAPSTRRRQITSLS